MERSNVSGLPRTSSRNTCPRKRGQGTRQAGVLPPADEVDALHVAVATVCEMDVLASWNQRHLANIRRRDLFNSVNRVVGYRKMLEIANPLEVLYE